MNVTAIFDIGKTNKKCILFDRQYQEVFRRYTQLEEIEDEDGFPCENLEALQQWIQSCLKEVLANKKFTVTAINFSTYGASLVHIDKRGKAVSPLYNYLKPYPEEILASFYEKYGGQSKLSRETASPALQMLNSGLQLSWLKYARPEVFRQIRWSLHLPQYLSYLLTGIPQSEYTSIGCHTFLWDYAQQDYHAWVYAEGLHHLLPPIVSTHTTILKDIQGQGIQVGVGIHDSSAALLAYIKAAQEPFLLISTGTWSISMNPFNQALLTEADLQHDCLNFMQPDGQAVKAARLFLGNEYALQIQSLNQYFNKAADYHKGITFDAHMYQKLHKAYKAHFHFESIQLERPQPPQTHLAPFQRYEEAYHQLMMELMELQIQSANRAIGHSQLSSLYVDGGFTENAVFMELLGHHYSNLKLHKAHAPLGSALGAAQVISS